MELALIEYSQPTDRLAEVDEHTLARGLHAYGVTTVWVAWDAASYAAYKGPREDTSRLRAAWAAAAHNEPEATPMRMALRGLADSRGERLTAVLEALAASIGITRNTLFTAMRTGQKAALYIPAIHAQY